MIPPVAARRVIDVFIRAREGIGVPIISTFFGIIIRMFSTTMPRPTSVRSFRVRRQPSVSRAPRLRGQVLEASDEASLTSFAEQHLADSYRSTFAPGALLEHLHALRAVARGASGGVMVRRDESGDLIVTLEGARTASVRVALDDEGAITKLTLAESEPEAAAPELGRPAEHSTELGTNLMAGDG